MVYVVGIDLGTKKSCIGVWNKGKVDIVPDAENRRSISSCVAFTESEILVGEPQFEENPRNTIHSIKKLQGRFFSMKKINLKAEIRDFEYQVGALKVAVGWKPIIEADYRGVRHKFEAEEISGIILGAMKRHAEMYLKENVDGAVITIPTMFNNCQRRATRDAAKIAGFKRIKLINESTAVAIAYGLDKRNVSTVFIFSLGAGSFSTSVISIDEGFYAVEAHAGDSFLGGDDFDTIIFERCISDFKLKNRGVDIMDNLEAMRRLREACEKAKRALSVSKKVSIEVDNLHEGIDFYCTLTQGRFEELCDDLLKRLMASVEECLEEACINKEDIDDIILAGGCCRMPKLKNLIRDYFNREPCQTTDETVAIGSAVVGAVMAGEEVKGYLEYLEVSSYLVGVEPAGIQFPKNSNLPVCKSSLMTTHTDRQPSISMRMVEGDLKAHLGWHQVKIPLKPKGVPMIALMMGLDEDGILEVKCVDNDTMEVLELKCEIGNLSEDEIKKKN